MAASPELTRSINLASGKEIRELAELIIKERGSEAGMELAPAGAR